MAAAQAGENHGDEWHECINASLQPRGNLFSAGFRLFGKYFGPRNVRSDGLKFGKDLPEGSGPQGRNSKAVLMWNKETETMDYEMVTLAEKDETEEFTNSLSLGGLQRSAFGFLRSHRRVNWTRKQHRTTRQKKLMYDAGQMTNTLYYKRNRQRVNPAQDQMKMQKLK
ncbi:hypothetical protein Bbelb_111080 [Branchiostoma belcheri]|nr:hypothetical protein Bbelb_111080 [Branchiostoma belcheri]